MVIKKGIMRSLRVRRYILLTRPVRHNRNTAKAGKKAVIQNVLNIFRFSWKSATPANSNRNWYTKNRKK